MISPALVRTPRRLSALACLSLLAACAHDVHTPAATPAASDTESQDAARAEVAPVAIREAGVDSSTVSFRGEADAASASMPDAALPNVASCLNAPASGCTWGSVPSLGFVHIVTPSPEAEYPERSVLRVTKRHPYNLARSPGSPPVNETLFDVVSTPPLAGKEQLAFDATPPLAVASAAIPEQLVVEHYVYGGGGCPEPNGELSIAGTRILRASDGTLLQASSYISLLENGRIEAARADAFPFELRWRDAGCAPCGSSGYSSIAVELRLKGAATPLIEALPGEAKTLQLDGREYTFRLGAARARIAQGCGEGHWDLIRNDLLTMLNEDGSVRE
jgi:hypothetical protein